MHQRLYYVKINRAQKTNLNISGEYHEPDLIKNVVNNTDAIAENATEKRCK
jgi:hypothetical protein